MSLLEIKNLQITFGGLDALSNLDFAIEEGEIRGQLSGRAGCSCTHRRREFDVGASVA